MLSIPTFFQHYFRGCIHDDPCRRWLQVSSGVVCVQLLRTVSMLINILNGRVGSDLNPIAKIKCPAFFCDIGTTVLNHVEHHGLQSDLIGSAYRSL